MQLCQERFTRREEVFLDTSLKIVPILSSFPPFHRPPQCLPWLSSLPSPANWCTGECHMWVIANFGKFTKATMESRSKTILHVQKKNWYVCFQEGRKEQLRIYVFEYKIWALESITFIHPRFYSSLDLIWQQGAFQSRERCQWYRRISFKVSILQPFSKQLYLNSILKKEQHSCNWFIWLNGFQKTFD